MIYLFTSGATPRYLIDALDVICYPVGHTLRFRYQEKYVSRFLTNSPVGTDGRLSLAEEEQSALIIYADRKDADRDQEFRFYPLRLARIRRITRRSTAYYVDFVLGGFVSYGQPHEVGARVAEYNARMQSLREYPLPGNPRKPAQYPKYSWDQQQVKREFSPEQTARHQGWFLNFCARDPVRVDVVPPQGQDRAWDSTVEALVSDSSLRSALFYRVDGFFTISQSWWQSVRGQECRERAVRPKQVGVESRYDLPAGENVVMKVLFYQPESADGLREAAVSVLASGDGFAGISQRLLRIDTRYNEERVVIACKRVLDHVLTTIAINQEEDEEEHAELITAQPFFLTQITPPRTLIFWTIFLLFVAAVLLSLGPDSIAALGEVEWLKSCWGGLAQSFVDHKGSWSSVAKALAGGVSLITGFIAFRRLPVGR